MHSWAAGAARLRLRNLVIVLSLSFPLPPGAKGKGRKLVGSAMRISFLLTWLRGIARVVETIEDFFPTIKIPELLHGAHFPWIYLKFF